VKRSEGEGVGQGFEVAPEKKGSWRGKLLKIKAGHET